MNREEIEQFRKEFKQLVYQKSEVEDSKRQLKTLHAYDKNGSHENAILKELDKLDDLRRKFKELLKGKTYDQWRGTSKKISYLTQRLRNSQRTKEKIQTEIDNLILS